jgi:hypothetical protein
MSTTRSTSESVQRGNRVLAAKALHLFALGFDGLLRSVGFMASCLGRLCLVASIGLLAALRVDVHPCGERRYQLIAFRSECCELYDGSLRNRLRLQHPLELRGLHARIYVGLAQPVGHFLHEFGTTHRLRFGQRELRLDGVVGHTGRLDRKPTRRPVRGAAGIVVDQTPARDDDEYSDEHNGSEYSGAACAWLDR